MRVIELENFVRPEGFYDEDLAIINRTKHLTNELTYLLKMDLYNSSCNGNTEEYISLIKSGNYPALEECSAAGYFWTALHYACFYGHYDIVKFTLDLFKNNPNKVEMMSIQSIEGLTPYAVAIIYCSEYVKKRRILQLFVDYEVIDVNLLTAANKDIFQLASENKVLDILEPYMKAD